MKLKAILEGQKNNSSAYDLVVGSVFKEELNETLDSGSIIISNVEPSRKLELEPYQYVYIYDTESDFEKYFLVDNFVENYVNLDTPYYEYTIALMSETKLLEKIQLPNRTIRNELNSRLKVNEVINQFCALYIPKIRVYDSVSKTWSYKYLIDFQDVISTNGIFYVDCPDMEFNHPTLRQVLTSLMQVVGCLPRIVNHKLTYVNLRLKPTEFVIPNGRKYIVSTSNSSDSFINSINSLTNNLIGEDNTIVNELLGFRDKDKVLLQHTENLVLTTQYGIKEIKNLTLNALGNVIVSYNMTYLMPITNVVGGVYNIGATIDASTSVGNYILKLYIEGNYSSYSNVNIRKVKYTFYNFDPYYNENQLLYVINKKPTAISQTYEVENIVMSGKTYSFAPTPDNGNGYNTCIVEITDAQGNVAQLITFTPLFNAQPISTDLLSNTTHLLFYVPRVCDFDITSLVFEKDKRKLKRTDLTFTPSTIEELATYYYTTLEYTYGQTKIEGFSQNYSYVEWYGNREEVFIDNLFNVLKQNKDISVDIQGLLHLFDINYNVIDKNDYTVFDIEYLPKEEGMSPYASLSFTIEYVPFNEVNLKFDKSKDIPLLLTQLDNQESAIPSLTAFALREQEKVERIGNNVVKINASNITNLNEINALNTKYNDSIIFSKEIAYYEDFCNANYIATKDYVLKNYFTNIQTKYRGYQYVDYEKSVLRIENKKFYLYLNAKSMYGTDILGVGNYSTSKSERREKVNDYFLSFLVNENNIFDTLHYTIKGEQTKQYYRNDLSIIKFNNDIALTYRDFDSVSGGIQILSPSIVSKKVGGYVQSWLMRDQADYNSYNKTIFTDYSYIPNFDNEYKYIFTDNKYTLSQYQQLIYRLPLVRLDDFNADEYNGKMIYLASNIDSSLSLFSQNMEYFKSLDEVLSETIQFEYVSGNEDLILGSHFVDYKQLIKNAKIGYIETSQETADFETIFTRGSEIIKNCKRNTKNAIIIQLTTEFNYFIVAYNDTNYIILAKGNGNIPTLEVSVSDIKSIYCYELLRSDRENIYKPTKKVKFNNSTIRECEE